MRRTSRAAISLVEMLVAMAVTLIMMGAVVTMFGNVGNSISGSRAMMEISERLRNARNVLQRDLGNVTATMLPPRSPESAEGFFEYVEGPRSDANPIFPDAAPVGPPAWVTLLGDNDDVLMMTIRSNGDPYVGRLADGNVISSLTAEVVWFLTEQPLSPVLDVSAVHLSGALEDEPRRLKTLHRRVLLVSPSTSSPTAGDDISASSFSGTRIANTLSDLTKRENRYGHFPSSFPYQVVVPGTPHPTTPKTDIVSLIEPLSGVRQGEDIILTNVLAFDVKAYDPNVPVLLNNNVATLPSDPGYSGSIAGYGGYVDLNYANDADISYFSGPGDTKSGLTAVYDTWSTHYEAAGTATGIDGLDNNVVGEDGYGVVDDISEMQAPPPYPYPLRGIQIKIRVYEPDSKQVREVTVVQDFLPQ